MADLTLIITYFAFLLGLGVLLANLMKKVHIPDTFFLLLLGLVLGPTLYMNPWIMQYIQMELVDVSLMGEIPDFFRLLALIMVVFTGTFSMGFRVFKKFSTTAINLAIIGVILNTLVIGVVANFLFGIGWIYSFLLAAILSGTGASVIFTFQNILSKHKPAIEVLKVESIMNSPLSVLLPIMFLGFVGMTSITVIAPTQIISQFWMMIVVGVGTGVVIGVGVSKLLKSILQEYTALLIFSIALVIYALSELLGGSGMLAVAVAGLIIGDLAFPEKQEVKKFDDHLSELFRITVFTLLGAQVALFMPLNEFLIIFLFFIAMVMFRPVFLMPLVRRAKNSFTRRDILLMSFVAPRGISAAAMAPIVGNYIIASATAETLPAVSEFAVKLNNIIFIVILLSVLLSTIVAKLAARDHHKPDEGKDEEKREGEEKGGMKDWLEDNIEKGKKKPLFEPKKEPMDEKDMEEAEKI
jgi:cell volume regulation protein A